MTLHGVLNVLAPIAKCILALLPRSVWPDWVFGVTPLSVKYPPDSEHAIRAGKTIVVPRGTSVTIDGTCRVKPPDFYWLVVKTGSYDYRPQFRLSFVQGKWKVSYYVGNDVGMRNVIIARCSHAIDVAFEHYSNRRDYLDPIQRLIWDKHIIDPESDKDIHVKVWQPVVMKGSVKGFDAVFEFDIRVDPTPAR
jgi:hypothetical protein